MFIIWLVSWVIIGVLISFKTKSHVSIVGGSFIASLLFTIMLSNYFNPGLKTDPWEEEQKQEITRQENKALRLEKRAEETKRCKEELRCWGERNSLKATYKVQDLIERQAKYAFKWTDGVLGAKITRFRWKNQRESILTYFGDKIQFQNAFGAWKNMIYQCDYDPINDRIINLQIKPGRM